jgi:TolB protein
MRAAHHGAALLVLLALSGCGDKAVAPRVPPPFTLATVIDSYPAWAPSGRVLLYQHEARTLDELRLGRFQVWRASLDSMTSHYVTAGQTPRWAPNARAFVFVREGLIYRRDLGSGEETLLTPFDPTTTTSYFPDWSPDGSRIVFDTNHEDPTHAHVIWIMNADGSGLEDISVHGTGEWRMARWSPAGTKIVHSRWEPSGSPNPDLFLMDTTGVNSVRLTSEDEEDYYPCWSPDGSQIAWWKGGSPNPGEDGIWVMRADGSGAHELIAGGSRPAWSPNGSELAFSRADSTGRWEILWLANADGSHAHPLPFSGPRPTSAQARCRRDLPRRG